MKTVTTIILLLWTPLAVAFEPSVLHGQWGARQQRADQPDRYFFLTINTDFSGVLIRTRKGERIIRRFSAEDTHTREAYLELDLPEDETAILWAWRQNNGLRRINGLLFEEGRTAPVRNMLPVPLEYLGPDHALRSDPVIRSLLDKHPYDGPIEPRGPARPGPVGDI